MPELKGFNFSGGSRIIPEFVALTVALSMYTAAFIAEIVRAGIQSVHKGQMEAGASLRLSRGTTLPLIVVPQALRGSRPPPPTPNPNSPTNPPSPRPSAKPNPVPVVLA